MKINVNCTKRSRYEMKKIQSNYSQKTNFKMHKIKYKPGYASVVPATQEAKAGR
jgi:hypothetical protein